MYSVQFTSFVVVSSSPQPHGLQHARPPCPSPTPGVYSNSCPLSQWCHPAISTSVIPFSSCPQSFPASGSFQMSPSHQTAKVLEFQLQHQSSQWIFRTDFACHFTMTQITKHLLNTYSVPLSSLWLHNRMRHNLYPRKVYSLVENISI